jgi:hypothetical protein
VFWNCSKCVLYFIQCFHRCNWTQLSLLPTGSGNMIQRQALTAIAAGTIYTIVQKCLTSCYFVCVDMFRYIVEQRVFSCMNRMWNVVPLESVGRKFRRKFRGIMVRSTTGVHKLIDKVRSTGSLLDNMPAKERPCVCRRINLLKRYRQCVQRQHFQHLL